MNKKFQVGDQQLSDLHKQLKANEVELKIKENATLEALEFAQNIIDTVHEPLLILDNELKIISASKFFYSMFCVSPDETKGEFLYNLGNNQWNIPVLTNLLTDILSKNSIIEDYEIEHNFEKIGEKIMLLNARELQQEGSKRRLILLSIKDITLRRNIEKDLLLLNTALEGKSRDMQQILYITTHDLRSPLVNIQGFNKELAASLRSLSELLKSVEIPASLKNNFVQILEEEIPEAMHFISSSTSKMDALLKGLLALSRLERQKPSFKQLDMNQLMLDVVDNHMFEIQQNKIILEINDLPNCKGDELQINQLFSNLIDNALKFFDSERQGKIKISGIIRNGFIEYSVQDNGIGIHPDHQEKVFELFHKLNPQKRGIGLGMSIVKQIVEKHNGKIVLESKVNVGTKFIIFIPV